ncbi:MAG TPA: antibiotic biosynthesis monooxygenase [Pseudomonas sp.]|uniref:antibiotic biosynthesis monooxygenase n=1 Tax=unclassified Pseudomonas TaxID=196821 RepID=UPI000EC954EB|nr:MULTISPECIES: antibiotic biosynthesis monooxygenase [unclassified Pseudomonas]HAB02868.1 antibiotic biosynthesis monooxygenase [Pseudomonas sp.]
MTAMPNALWFTQMIEYHVPACRQESLAQALATRSEQLASRCPGLQGVSIQASDDGSRVLQCLQWQSRQAWEASAQCFSDEPFLQLLRQNQAHGVNFAAFQALRSLVRSSDGGLHCQLSPNHA